MVCECVIEIREKQPLKFSDLDRLEPFYAVLLGRRLQDNELSQVWRPQKELWRSMVSLMPVETEGNGRFWTLINDHR